MLGDIAPISPSVFATGVVDFRGVVLGNTQGKEYLIS